MSEKTEPLSLSLGHGVILFFDLEEGFYRGISRAELDGTPFLVAGRRQPPYFRTPEGIAYGEFRFLGQRTDGEETVIELEAVGRCTPAAENMDMFGFPILSSHMGGEVRDPFRIHISPHAVEVGGEYYRGFSLRYEWQNSERSIHWLLESVALAPGGTVTGARLMAPNMTARVSGLEEILQPETACSSAENYGTPCIEAPARGGGSAFFDLVQGKHGTVATYFEDFPARPEGALKANCQKAPGEDFVTVSDFHYAPLTGHFRSARRFVVASTRAVSSREDAINRWTAWSRFTGRLWRSRLGLPEPRPVPTLALDGTGAGGVDPGTTYPELLETWARRLDWVVEQGFKAIILHTPEWIGAANRRTIIFGGNNCCPWEFKLSGHLGGNAGLKAFCDSCHARGVKVIVWIAGHLHREAPIWTQHPDWVARTTDQRAWDGHYGIIHSISFSSDARAWVFNDLRQLKEETGVDGIWYDSFTNLSYGVVNWQSPRREPNAGPVLGFLSDLAAIGYEIQIEGMSQLGVSSWGNLSPKQVSGHEEILIDTSLRYYREQHWQDDPALTRHFCFRMLAARAPIGVWLKEFMGRPESFPPKLPEWFAPLMRAFNAVAPRMDRRVLLPQGVLWLDAENIPSAFFALENSPADTCLPKNITAQDLITRSSLTAAPAQFEAGHIYRLGNAVSP